MATRSSSQQLRSSRQRRRSVYSGTIHEDKFQQVDILSLCQNNTNKLYKIIESSPGPVCFVVRGLDGFYCEFTRIVSFLARLEHTSHFVILVCEHDSLPNHGVGLADSPCSSGYYTICFFSDDLIAGPSDKVKLMYQAWANTQAGKNSEDGERRAGSHC